MALLTWLIFPELTMMFQLAINAAQYPNNQMIGYIAAFLIPIYWSMSPILITKLMMLCSIPIGIICKQLLLRIDDGTYPFGWSTIISILVVCQLIMMIITILFYQRIIELTELRCEGCQQTIFCMKNQIQQKVIERHCGLWHKGCPGNKCGPLNCFCGQGPNCADKILNECGECMFKCRNGCQDRIIDGQNPNVRWEETQGGKICFHLSTCSTCNLPIIPISE